MTLLFMLFVRSFALSSSPSPPKHSLSRLVTQSLTQSVSHSLTLPNRVCFFSFIPFIPSLLSLSLSLFSPSLCLFFHKRDNKYSQDNSRIFQHSCLSLSRPLSFIHSFH